MNVVSRLISVVIVLFLVAFIGYQLYGIFKGFRARKKQKESAVQSDKQD